jgi:hypothetical protein
MAETKDLLAKLQASIDAAGERARRPEATPKETDISIVTVTVRVPEQFTEFTYTKAEWDEAVRTKRVEYLMDNDLSDMDITEEVYGPDGHQVDALW